MASGKTHTVQQRALIARVVVMTKILYLAHFTWPTAEIVKRLQALIGCFVWGTTETDGQTTPAMHEPVPRGAFTQARTAWRVKADLLALIAKLVPAWATTATRYERMRGDILLGGTTVPLFVTLSISIHARDPALGNTM